MTDPLTIIQGDALSSLRRLPDESVQCCVTSPPYWGLRDYGLDPIVWDQTVECDHVWAPWTESHDERESRKSGKTRTTDRFYGSKSRKFDGNHQKHFAGTHCAACGAWLGCLGLEPTPDLYIAHIVQIFREMKRVLRRDGTLWLNLGDSYCSTAPGTNGDPIHRRGIFAGVSERRANGSKKFRPETPPEMKPKDLVGIPWMVAFALRADGWYLRSDIIWNKPNPMPESVTDRPTRSHDYVFLLSKNQRYYYDHHAIKEPVSENTHSRGKNTGPKTISSNSVDRTKVKNNTSFQAAVKGPVTRRNRRSVWTIATRPFPEAHFATFPPDLVIPCVLAGSRPGDVIIDPFGGSGTVGKVALERGRKAILIEPNASYIEMIERRCGINIGLPISA